MPYVIRTSNGGVRQVGTKPVGARPVGTRPVGARPVGARPVGTRPVGARPVGIRPVGIRPVGIRPVGIRSIRFIGSTRSGSIISRTASRIEHKNRLGTAAGVNATGAPIEHTELPWFPELSASFAISIRMHRWEGMRARLDKWAPQVQMWAGTDGNVIDRGEWVRKRWTHLGSTLKRGELGCSDSHVRLWETIVQRNLSMTLIMEDDANIRHTRAHYNRIRSALDEAKNFRWDLLYIGRSHAESNHGRLSSTMMRPRGCNGLFAYILTLEGAKKLLSGVRPYVRPIDIYVAHKHDTNQISAIALHPTLCYVVPVHSDTRHIS